MISFSDPSAGMNHPSSATPSSAGKVISSYASFCSDGACTIGERSCLTNESAVASRIRSICSSVGAGAWASVALDIDSPVAQPASRHDARLQLFFAPLPEARGGRRLRCSGFGGVEPVVVGDPHVEVGLGHRLGHAALE